jgi:hypothetical protein
MLHQAAPDRQDAAGFFPSQVQGLSIVRLILSAGAFRPKLASVWTVVGKGSHRYFDLQV